MGINATIQWRTLLDLIIRHGESVVPRGRPTTELLAHQTWVGMKHPVVLDHRRKLGYRFMAAEAAWILSGDNRLETIKPFSRHIENFSDDGVTFFGAYGPKVVQQLPYVVDCLMKDPATRQAVINIWRETPGETKDVPCTLSHQFLIREHPVYGPQLNMVTTMRSSDAWLGWPYDTFNATMLAGVVCLHLRARGQAVLPGTLVFHMGSSHLYEPQVEEVIGWGIGVGQPPEAPRNVFEPDEFNPLQFASPEALVEHLWGLAHRDRERLQGSWLVRELLHDQ